jgi:hypothetical protein
LLVSNAASEIIDDKECSLDMLYDTALDDGPILINNPSCLHKGRNAILVTHDDALIHESPILFLKSPIYTIEEKYAYIEKYLCGLQLSYKKSYCNSDAMTKNDINSYFERGKHVNEYLNKSNDPFLCQRFLSYMIQIGVARCVVFFKIFFSPPPYKKPI